MVVIKSASLVAENCFISAVAPYTTNENGAYNSMSVGINSSGICTLKNCTVFGMHSGVNSTGELLVDGGSYSSYGHGGIYFGGKNSGTSYIKNAKLFPTQDIPGDLEVTAGYIDASAYIGGNTGNDGITVYMDNCEIPSGIVLRGTSGEQNNTLYISNSKMNAGKKMRIDNNTHRLYIGRGCNFDIDDVYTPESFTQFDLTTVVFNTDETYIKD